MVFFHLKNECLWCKFFYPIKWPLIFFIQSNDVIINNVIVFFFLEMSNLPDFIDNSFLIVIIFSFKIKSIEVTFLVFTQILEGVFNIFFNRKK